MVISTEITHPMDPTVSVPVRYFENVTGPVSSGKTSYTVRMAKKLESEGFKCRIFSYIKDRNDITLGKLISRDGYEHPCKFIEKLFDSKLPRGKRYTELRSIIEDGIQWVFIDEGQFFKNVVKFAMLLVANGIRVVVAHLNGTWKRKHWRNIRDIDSYTNNRTFFDTKCSTEGCTGDGIHSLKVLEGNEKPRNEREMEFPIYELPEDQDDDDQQQDVDDDQEIHIGDVIGASSSSHSISTPSDEKSCKTSSTATTTQEAEYYVACQDCFLFKPRRRRHQLQ